MVASVFANVERIGLEQYGINDGGVFAYGNAWVHGHLTFEK